MAATYTEVSLEDMEKFLRRGFRSLRPKQGSQFNEYYFDLTLGPSVDIRVWSSVGVRSGTGAEKGADAIRVQLLSSKDNKPLEKGKAPIVKRTQGWRTSLQDRIEDLIEKYESNDEFWEDWASTRRRRGDPERVQEIQEERAPEPELREEPQRGEFSGTFAKLRDGTWGVRVQGSPQSGDTVLVSRKDGTQSKQTIDQVVYTGSGFSLVTIVQTGRRYAGEEEPGYSYGR
jgi:hypothetical protein